MSCVQVGRWRVLIAFILWLAPAVVWADSVTLAWDASTGASGYTVRWGTAVNSYPNSADAGNNTTFVINGLTAGATYWAVVQAYNSAGTSAFSTPLQFTVPLATIPCSYSISPAAASVSDAASTGTITVNTQAGCAWSAASGSTFLTFQNGTGRSGPGSVTFAVAANTGTSARTGLATVAGNSFSVSQAAAPAACTYSISPASTTVSDAASTGTITVTTQAGCAWNASTSSNFLTFQNGTGRSGSGSVTFAITANTGTTTRTAAAMVAGKSFSVSQAGAPGCGYSISPGAASVSDAASTGTITVTTTQASCTWNATSTSSFLSFQNGIGRTGSGTVTFAVTTNTNTSVRIGTATVAGNPFSVSQAAAPGCSYSISPGSTSVTDAAGTGTIMVTTQANCPWSATSASSFLTFQNGAGRTGSGSVTFAVTANTATSDRTGTATVAGNPFSVSQAAAASQNCTYAISPASTSVGATASTGTVTVTTQAGCAWTATSASSFLTFQSGMERTGPGSVTFAVTANTSSLRTGQGTIAGVAFSVRQAAPGCTYSVDPERTTVAAGSSTGTITVTTQAGCAWTAKSMSTFITIPNGIGRSGPGSVDFTVAQNSTTSIRYGIAAVASTTVFVTQDAASAGAPPPPPPPPSSTSPWSSDFNNDGKNDLLLQDSLGGGVEAWFLDNSTLKGKQSLSHANDANWALVGRGDFNADGKPDLVWQHKAEGLIDLWYMDGTTQIGTATPSIDRLADVLWRIAGVGDFNKDGKPDILWQHSGDGSLAVWMMNGATVTETVNIVPNGTPDLLWKVVGVGDFNADGSSDLIWRHMGQGDVAAWLMNGVTRIVHAPLSPLSVPDQAWQIGAVTDANGDGAPDLVWEHTDGTIMIWHMTGTRRGTYPIIPATVPLGWHVVGPK